MDGPITFEHVVAQDHLKKRNALLAAGMLLLASLVIKWGCPWLIARMSEHGMTGVLDFLSGNSGGGQSADFYIGQIEKFFYGPLAVLCSTLAFLLFAFVTLQGAPVKRFFLSVFGFLLVTKLETLLNPVYGGDAITAVFAEAIWLARHNFDYLQLYHEPTYVMGGPRVYLLNIYPGFLALLMKLLPVKLFLLTVHTYVLAMSAAVVAFFHEIAKKIFTRKTSLLAATALLAMPIFLSQSELINMEMPVLFFTFLSAYFCVERKWAPATAFAVTAGLVKGSGLIASAAVFTVCLIIVIFDRKERRRVKVLLWGVGNIVYGLALAFLANLVHNQQTVIGFIKPFAAVVRAHTVLYVYLLCLLVFAGLLVRQYRRQKTGGLTVSKLLYRHHAEIVMFVFAGMWMMLYLNFTVMLARYKLLVYPFNLFCVCVALKMTLRDEWLQRAALGLLIVVACLSSYGWLETEKDDFHYIQIERSLEYRNVLNRDLKLAGLLEDKYRGRPVAAPSVIAQFLRLPELGYVRKPMDVTIYSMSCTYGGIKEFAGLKGMDLSRTVWVGYHDAISETVKDLFAYPVDPQDRVLGAVEHGDRKVTLFQGGLAVEKMRLIVEQNRTKRRHYGYPSE